MCAFNKAKAVIACCAGGLVVSLCCCSPEKNGTDTWEVLFPGLPEKITTAKASHNTLFYVLKQTHEPLFRKDDGDNLTSRLLLSWSRSVDSKTFSFCPNQDLKFNEKARFDRDYFFKYISSVTAAYNPDFSISENTPCFEIRFRKSAKSYLDFLTLYENAPTRLASPQIEDGLGPFMATSVSKNQIVLVRKNKTGNGYNTIVVHDYKGGKDRLLKDQQISDFNRIQSSDVPAWTKTRYRGFDNIRLKSVILVINHPDKQVRTAIYNCVDVAAFRRAYFPGLEGGHDIQNVFPLGVPGALAGKPSQSCGGRMIKKKIKVEFANLRDDNHKELGVYIKELSTRTGIDIKVVNYVPTELTALRSKKTWAYNLLVMAADAVRPEQDAFLSPFLRKKKPFIEYPLSALRAMYNEMTSSEDLVIKSALAEKIAAGLARESAVIPLFQTTGRMYYPENIKNLEAGKGFLEYPEIAEFRW